MDPVVVAGLAAASLLGSRPSCRPVVLFIRRLFRKTADDYSVLRTAAIRDLHTPYVLPIHSVFQLLAFTEFALTAGFI